MSAADGHAVQVCEILSVRKTEESDRDGAQARRSRRKAKQCLQLHPHAFTGTKHVYIYDFAETFNRKKEQDLSASAVDEFNEPS